MSTRGQVYRDDVQAFVTPFSEAATATAGSQNTITIAGIAGRRTFITRIVVTAQHPAAVKDGVVTMTHIAGSDGATQTISWQFNEAAATGGQLIIDASRAPYMAYADDQDIVVDIPAIGSGAVTALEVSGFFL